MRSLDVILTHVSEPLDDLSVERLRTMLRKRVKLGRFVHIIDLRNLAYLDSPTLGALVRLLRIVQESGGAVGLLVDRWDFRKVLTITGLDRIIPVYESETEALSALWSSDGIPA